MNTCSTCRYCDYPSDVQPCLTCLPTPGGFPKWQPAKAEPPQGLGHNPRPTVAPGLPATLPPPPPPAPTNTVASAPALAAELVDIVLRQCGGFLSGPGFEAAEKARALRAALASQPAARVFLVATGETHEGEETYTRHEGAPPPLCDFETLYAAPQPVAPAVPVAWMQTWRDDKHGISYQRLFLASEYPDMDKREWAPFVTITPLYAAAPDTAR